MIYGHWGILWQKKRFEKCSWTQPRQSPNVSLDRGVGNNRKYSFQIHKKWIHDIVEVYFLLSVCDATYRIIETKICLKEWEFNDLVNITLFSVPICWIIWNYRMFLELFVQSNCMRIIPDLETRCRSNKSYIWNRFLIMNPF